MLLTMVSVSLVIALEYDGSESVVNVIITATTSNVLIDILSISLSFKFYEKYYQFCCQRTDARFRRCCSYLAHHAMSDQARLAQTVNALNGTDIAGGTTPAVVLATSSSVELSVTTSTPT